MKLMRFTLRGLSPGMLLDPKTDEVLEALRTKKSSQKRTDWTVEQEAGTKFYRSENGRMGLPIANLVQCLVLAGQHVKTGKKQISTAESTILFDFLDFPEDFCEFLDLDEQGNLPWRPFKAGGQLKQRGSKTAVCIVRPRVLHWRLSFVIKFDDKREVSEETVIKLVTVAGRKSGLCAWRPGCKGRFGRFVIEKLEVVPIEEEEQVMERVDYAADEAPAELLALAKVA